jgi:hypothetical protein
MASRVPFIRGYAYILIRVQFTKGKLTPTSLLFCHYGETNYVYHIRGLVRLDETPIAAILRFLRQLAGFRPARSFPMFLCNVIGGYKNHEPIKIILHNSDVLFDQLKYRNSHCALKL